MPTWDSAQYLQFADERTRPARELLTRIPLDAPERVVDLGCGPGNSTALLRARWPGAHHTGVDSSKDMLRRAASDAPDIEWVEADVAEWVPEGPVDVLFANALFQWLPDHAAAFPRWFEWLRPGGVFAVQMPRNFEEPSHRLMRELPGPWLARTARVRAVTPVATPAFYYDLLAPRAASVDIWQTTYEHVMPDAASIVEWLKGTGLRPYLESLSDGERDAYLGDYAAALTKAYPARSDGRCLFSFPRLFIVAQR